jgi:hypothetical protein
MHCSSFGGRVQSGNVYILPPAPRPWGVSDEGAVELCREWMQYFGARDTVTAAGAVRAVCDLYSAHYLGWVDNGRGNVGLDVVERAIRTAVSDGRLSLIFVRGGMRHAAWQRAEASARASQRYRRRSCRYSTNRDSESQRSRLQLVNALRAVQIPARRHCCAWSTRATSRGP